MTDLLDVALLLLNIDKKDISVLGEGFESIVIEQRDGTIFRIAKSVETARDYTKECQLLPHIQSSVDVEIPLPISNRYDPSIVPPGIMSYKKLKGTSLHPDRLSPGNLPNIAKQLAKFISKLHTIPVHSLPVNCPQEGNNKNRVWELRANTQDILTKVLTVKEQQKLSSWWDESLEDEPFYTHPHVLCHGDLWYANILTDESGEQLTGIIDFSAMHIGDPAKDLATQSYMGDAFYRLLYSEYASGFPEDTTLEYRVKRHQGLRELGGLVHALRYDPSEIEDAVSKIKHVIIM
ncbi:phosphotransferase [Paenibacillus chondroitinus]|uniref:Phosphotransferase n=1 Tax=Paenibacillus chondroitinus TaxID=59842 RepID=A0ABU6D7A9_9BACL|nr:MULTISPECIES: phosphotransferase [Paenibacillus]MCY9658830.1 aminoglycoside phosphotransferase family protein [Paenibacillus anseongense]MEB4792828.1 phosphotransferase [Paenibacillus chondroitinus]